MARIPENKSIPREGPCTGTTPGTWRSSQLDSLAGRRTGDPRWALKGASAGANYLEQSAAPGAVPQFVQA